MTMDVVHAAGPSKNRTGLFAAGCLKEAKNPFAKPPARSLRHQHIEQWQRYSHATLYQQQSSQPSDDTHRRGFQPSALRHSTRRQPKPSAMLQFPRLATASPQHRSAHCVSSATTPTPPLVTIEASHLAAPSPSVTADEPHPVTPISHAYQVPQCSIIGNDLVCSPNRPARALRKSRTTVSHRSNPKASSTIDDRTISTRIAAFERENFHLIRNLLQATGRTHVPFS